MKMKVNFSENNKQIEANFSEVQTLKGASAYEVACENGFEGTEEEWLESLRGQDGYTPIKGVDYFDGEQGIQGEKGNDGYTPIKGKDYFDGVDGTSASHSWNGTTLTITSASGTSSANLKGDKGDKGDTGERGEAFTYEDFTPEQLEDLKGEKGNDGIIAPSNGFFTMGVDEEGNLYIISPDGGTTPNFEYDSTTGNLYVKHDDGTRTILGNAKGDKGENGYTPIKGVDYFDGKDGKDGADGYTPIKGVDYFDGQNGQDGQDGKDGSDGYTPQKNVDYFDGKDGTDGKDGVSVSHQWNGTTLTITSASGTSSADLKGEKGNDGYTPIKGKDYFDGQNGQDGKDGSAGKDGISATHSWNGTTLTVTSASGTSSSNLKGEKGDKGDKGDTGASGSDANVTSQNIQNALGYVPANQNQIPSNTETWTFTLEDGSTVTKKVYIG